MAKFLIALGLALVLIGGFWYLLESLGIQLGKLPGDIHIKGKRGSFYFPLTTCIVLSIVLSGLLYLYKTFIK